MHKFKLHPCRVEKDENGNNIEFIVSLGSIMNNDAMLFFPVPEDTATIINYIIKNENKGNLNVHQDSIGIYKTMIDSWKSGDKLLSGIVIDSRHVDDLDDDVIEASLVIIDDDGNLDSFTKTSFIHAVVIAAMEGIYITITDELLDKIYSKMVNENDENDEDDDNGDEKEPNNSPNKPNGKNEKNNHKFPSDSNVIRIAQRIMEGKTHE